MAVFVLGVVLLVLAPSVVALAIRRHRGGRHRAPEPLPAVVLARTSVGAVAIGSTASAVVLVSHGVPLTRPAPDAVRAAPAAPSPGGSTPASTRDVRAAGGPTSDGPTSDGPAPAVPTSLVAAPSVDVRRLAVAVPAPTRRVVAPEPRMVPAPRAPQVTTIPVAAPTSGRGGSTPQARPIDNSPSTDSPSTGSPSSPRPGRPASGGDEDSASGKDSAGGSGSDHDDGGTETGGETATTPATGPAPSSGSEAPSSGSESPSPGAEKPTPGDGGGRHRADR